MLSAAARSRLVVVLVGARNPQNIGSAARAMHDFGFNDLRVVNDFSPPFEAAQMEAKSAVRAEEVMRSARLFATLPEAIADCALVAGTTAIGARGIDGSVLALKDAAWAVRRVLLEASGLGTDPAPELMTEGLGGPGPATGRVALLFGSEKTGLTNEQLSFCSLLLTIPMFAPPGRHLSMNLGQSVAVCLYELVREGFEGSRELPELTGSLATAADRERLTAMLLEVMERSGYSERFPANSRPTVVRRLVATMGNTGSEAATWMGILRLILHSLTAPPNEEIPQ